MKLFIIQRRYKNLSSIDKQFYKYNRCELAFVKTPAVQTNSPGTSVE